MEPVIATVVSFSALMVPMLALWATAALYTLRSGAHCHATQFLFFGSLFLISFITLRTIASNDGYWLIHTASLGVMIVAGVMRRPSEEGIGLIDETLAA